MGQYYRFINVDRNNQASEIPLPFNFGLPWAKSLERLTPEELKEKFDFVIQGNGWEKTDKIIAIGDYGDIISYPNR